MAKRSNRRITNVTPPSKDQFKSNAYRSELSINDIRGLAWNAVQGNPQSYEILEAQNRKMAKIANSRMKALKGAHLNMFAYDRAITYLENNDLKRFPTTLPDQSNFKAIVDQMSELVAFINSKTSTIAGAKDTLDKKLDKISEFTGKEYNDKQKHNLGKLLGTDSISTLLRDIRGNSAEVIDALEDLSLTDIDSERITEIVDNYLQGWTPWDNELWFSRSRSMNYDQLLGQLRDLYDQSKESKS